jgi:hypothetical protein
LAFERLGTHRDAIAQLRDASTPAVVKDRKSVV